MYIRHFLNRKAVLCNIIITFIDLFGTGIVFAFHPNHRFYAGPLHALLLLTVAFYVLILTVGSLITVSRGERSKGINCYSADSEIVLSSFEEADHYVIEIKDNGSGFEMSTETLGKGGIGLKNALTRLDLMCGGTMTASRENEWTVLRIRIPKDYGRKQHAHDHS